MIHIIQRFLMVFIAAFFPLSAYAESVSWTDWVSSSDASSASGELLVETTIVNIEYSNTSSHRFVQLGTGTNYWDRGTPYTNGVIENDPLASELIALSAGGEVTINFSETVENPFIGLVSWNSNTVDFGVPIIIDSFGPGHWGNGTPLLNESGTGFFGSGEVHGIINLPGSFDSISFTHTSENWHGFTVGISGLASPVPEPSVVWLFGSAIFVFFGVLRKKVKTKERANNCMSS